MEFDFVSDERFKDLLQRDYRELKSCIESKSAKAVLILSGSIIEASLVEFFLQNLPAGQTETKLLKMGLGSLIDLAESEGLLSDTEKKLASIVQDYRNLIHPGRQIRKKEKYNFETAMIANSLVTITINAISNKQQALNHFTAHEIIEKLKSDWNFRTIFGTVAIKLRHAEREKLFDLLVRYEMEEKEKWDTFIPEGFAPRYEYHNLERIKSLIDILKPLLPSEYLILKLNELVSEIQKGDRLKAFALFNLLHEELDKLGIDEQEMIAIYMLSIFEEIIENCSELAAQKTYSTIGKGIKSNSGIKAFNDFTTFCIVHFDKKSIRLEMDVYEQAFNSLQEGQKAMVRQFAEEFMFKDGRQPPQNVMQGFVDAARQRGILSALSS